MTKKGIKIPLQKKTVIPDFRYSFCVANPLYTQPTNLSIEKRHSLQNTVKYHSYDGFEPLRPYHGIAVYIIRHLFRYFINTECCISSSRRKDTLCRVMRYKDGLPSLMIFTTAS